MEITRGKIQKAKKVVIYGPEGIGKSTFAARFPGAVFIDTEGSTNDMDVARLPRPTSWNMLFDEIEYIKTHTDECRTLVIDTVDWAELLCVEHICAVHNKKGKSALRDAIKKEVRDRISINVDVTAFGRLIKDKTTKEMRND